VKQLRVQLQREVASLYAFVEAISRACSPPPQAVSFSESSSKFFDYISHIADQTKIHLQNFENHADDDAEDFVEARTELLTLRATWRELHQFIKPSADADTLNQPTALIAALVNRLRELKGFESTDFTIFHTDSFDYAQANPSAIESAVTQLARIVDARPFDRNLALIGIPNSQGNALFLNCLLAHEVGEYAYAKRGVEASFAAEVTVALEIHMKDEFKSAPSIKRSHLTKVVLQWAKEIFCDLFAVRLVGPCYSYAYVELFDLLNLLSKDNALIVDAKLNPSILMYHFYPSHPFRVRAQVELLREEGWWDRIKDMDSRQSALMRGLLELKSDAFVEAENEAGGESTKLIEALFDLMPVVRQEVVKSTEGIDPHLHEYNLLYEVIAEYLKHGVVPSTLSLKDSDSSLQQVHASPITLLNASYRFYLEGVEELMNRIQGQNLASAENRAAWMRKIENWTTKALEDVALLQASRP